MNVIQWIWICIPLALSIIYLLGLIHNWYTDIRKHIIKKIYYLICFMWIFVFVIIFYNQIINISIFTKERIDTKIINICLTIVLLLLTSIIWDLMFISSRVIKDFSFKDIKLTTEEVEEIEEANLIRKKSINALYKVLDVQSKLRADMKNYVLENELNPIETYVDLLNKYAEYRKKIKLSSFCYNKEGINEFKEKYDLDDMQCSAILHSIKYNGICIPNNNKKDIIYATLYTDTIKEDMIIVLTGKYLIKNEHLIIQEIIDNYHLYINFEIQELKIQELSNAKVEGLQ